MFNKKRIKRLEEENERLKIRIEKLIGQLGEALVISDDKASVMAQEVVAKVLGRGIKYFDYTGMKHDEKVKYYNDAQAALRNKTIQNEVKHIVADLVEHIAKRSQSIEEVSEIRMTINGIEMLKEYLEGISDPVNEIKKDDLHNPI